MRVSERLHDRVLNEIVGIGLVSMPTAHVLAQERQFLLDETGELGLLQGHRAEGSGWSQPDNWSRIEIELTACKRCRGLGRCTATDAIAHSAAPSHVHTTRRAHDSKSSRNGLRSAFRYEGWGP